MCALALPVAMGAGNPMARWIAIAGVVVTCAVAAVIADPTRFHAALAALQSASDGLQEMTWIGRVGLSLVFDVFVFLALGPAGPVHRRLGVAVVKSTLAVMTYEFEWGTPNADTDRGSVQTTITTIYRLGVTTVKVATTAFTRSLGTINTLFLVSTLFALAEGWRTSWIRARRAAACAATRNLSPVGIRRLSGLFQKHKTPEWAGDVTSSAASESAGDSIEKVTWWNDVLATAWPNASKAAQMFVRNVLEPLLDHDKPAGISSMKFDQFSLGTTQATKSCSSCTSFSPPSF